MVSANIAFVCILQENPWPTPHNLCITNNRIQENTAQSWQVQIRDQEAAGSNPVTPMTVTIPKKSCDIFRKAFFCFCFDKAAFLQALSKYPVTKDKVFGIELKNRIFAGF